MRPLSVQECIYAQTAGFWKLFDYQGGFPLAVDSCSISIMSTEMERGCRLASKGMMLWRAKRHEAKAKHRFACLHMHSVTVVLTMLHFFSHDAAHSDWLVVDANAPPSVPDDGGLGIASAPPPPPVPILNLDTPPSKEAVSHCACFFSPS